MVAAALPLDCAASVDAVCRIQWREGDLSWQHYGHDIAGLASQVLLLLTPFALAYALWPGTAAAVALVSGAVGILIAAASFALYFVDGIAAGLVQRVDLAVLHIWVAIVAIGLLHATRAPPQPGPLIAVRPRDFLASA